MEPAIQSTAFRVRGLSSYKDVSMKSKEVTVETDIIIHVYRLEINKY